MLALAWWVQFAMIVLLAKRIRCRSTNMKTLGRYLYDVSTYADTA